MLKVSDGEVELVVQVSIKILRSKSPECYQPMYNHIVSLTHLSFVL